MRYRTSLKRSARHAAAEQPQCCLTCRLTEDNIFAAETAAEYFHGEVALVWLSMGAHSELEAQAENKKFMFVPIRGELDELRENE